MSSALEVSLKINRAKFKIDALVSRTVESIGDGSRLKSVKQIQTVLSRFRRTEYAVMAAFPTTMEEARKIGVTLRYTATQGSASMDPEDTEGDTMPERGSPVQELIRSLEVGYNRLSSIYASLTEASTQLPAIVQESEEGGVSAFRLAQNFLDAIERLRTLDLAERQEGRGQDGDILMTSPFMSPSHTRRCTPLRQRTTSAADQRTFEDGSVMADASRGHDIALDLAEQQWREHDTDILMTSPPVSAAHSRRGTPFRRRTTSAAYQSTLKEDSEEAETSRGHSEPQQSAKGLRRSARARHQPPDFSVGENSHRTRRRIQLDAELRSLRGKPGWNL